MIKIGDYEISFRRELTQWAREEGPHVWEWIFRIEWLSPHEKRHRKDWEESHPGEKYPV